MDRFLFGLGAGFISGALAALVTKFIEQAQAHSVPIGVAVGVVVVVLVWFREFIGDSLRGIVRFLEDI